MRKFINIINEAQISEAPIGFGAAAAAAMALTTPSAPATQTTTTVAAPSAAMDVELLKQIQRRVNFGVVFTREANGRDVWQLPKGYGDCEDIAMLKRKLLIEAGWPEDDLVIQIVVRPIQGSGRPRDGGPPQTEGHVVLLVKSLGMVMDSALDGDRGIPVMPWAKWAEKGKWERHCDVADLTPGHRNNVSTRCARDAKGRLK